MNTPLTNAQKDTLIADMLGDVGKLREELTAVEKHMAPMVEAMCSAADRMQEQCRHLTTASSQTRVFQGNLLVSGLLLFGGVLAGLGGAIGMDMARHHYVAGSALTADQRNNMAIGRDIQTAWPTLSSDTRTEIRRVLGERNKAEN